MNCFRTIVIGLVALVGTCAAAEAASADETGKISACLEAAKGDTPRERT
jgi:hypothetical protein